jgi:hypothetical protein
MFKCALLVTTAIVVAGSLSFRAAGSAAQARPAAADRSTNNEFLCSYGYFDVSSFISSYSGTVANHWTRLATPIKGTGKTVHQIIVREALGSKTDGARFLAGIHRNTPAGVPGQMIAQGSAKAPDTCGTVSISIPPTRLKSGEIYWIEERVPAPPFNNFASSQENQVFWAADPKAGRKAYAKYRAWYSDHLHSSVIPWTAQSEGVYARVK